MNYVIIDGKIVSLTEAYNHFLEKQNEQNKDEENSPSLNFNTNSFESEA